MAALGVRRRPAGCCRSAPSLLACPLPLALPLQDHPGFRDAAYKQRRVDICHLARTHRMSVAQAALLPAPPPPPPPPAPAASPPPLPLLPCSGQPIPRIQYTPEEVAVWGAVLRELRGLFPEHACKEVRWGSSSRRC